MAETATSGLRPANEPARIPGRHSPNGLFLRHARGRRRLMPARVAVGLASAASYAVLQDGRVGALAAAALLIGEAVEGAVLGRILRRWSEAAPVPRPARSAAAAAAGFQALTVAFAVALAWAFGKEGDTEFFVGVLLAGAAMDAGTGLPFHRRSAVARLTVYAVSFVALALSRIAEKFPLRSAASDHELDMVASLMLGLVIVAFIHFTSRTHARRTRDEVTILNEQARLVAAQQALETRERDAQRLALVARHANDGVVIYSPTGEIDWVNETFTRITGYKVNELVGRRIEEAVPADNIDPEGVARLIAARRDMLAYRGELRTRRKSGEDLWIEINLTPIPGPDGRPAMMIAVERDVTEAKAREAELARARAEAEAAMRAKERFLATMSHELRTPMNGVIGISELLAETRLDADQRLYVDTIVDSGQALLAIINDILDLSRLQSGAPVLSPEPLDIVTSVRGAMELLRPTALSKGIALNTRLPKRGPVTMADGGRLRQIVLNLLGNAIKFTEAGEVTLTLSLAESGGRHDIRIAVGDTGIGIPADRIGAVFDSFTQADNAIGRRFGGTGLGLTISRRLAQEMGGDIAVDSTLGKGSVFTLSLSLPAADSAAAAPGSSAPGPRTAGPGASGTGMTSSGPAARLPVILLAEDNRTNAMIVERMLRPEGYEVALAGDGRAAVDAFAKAPPDLVLMDISMPGMTGFEALRAIRETERGRGGPRRPVIALTAHSFEEDRRACFEAGFDGFVTKPVQKKTLLAEIARFLGPLAGAGAGAAGPGPAGRRPGAEPANARIRL